MADHSSWVDEVRRWYYAGTPPAGAHEPATADDGSDIADLGYEAANPALQSRHWPDAPTGGAGNLG